MGIENIGSYIDRVSGKIYQVRKRTGTNKFTPVAGPRVSFSTGVVDYITACGINLNPKSDDESVFEMIEINGILHRQ